MTPAPFSTHRVGRILALAAAALPGWGCACLTGNPAGCPLCPFQATTALAPGGAPYSPYGAYAQRSPYPRASSFSPGAPYVPPTPYAPAAPSPTVPYAAPYAAPYGAPYGTTVGAPTFAPYGGMPYGGMAPAGVASAAAPTTSPASSGLLSSCWPFNNCAICQRQYLLEGCCLCAPRTAMAAAAPATPPPPPASPAPAAPASSAEEGCGLCSCLPRIDPTGEKFLVWPKDKGAKAPPASNVTAPPVLTDSDFPAATTSLASLPAGLVAQDKLTVTPQRVLAPVGSEVVLKAGICAAEGFLLTEQEIEWQLARNGVGEFVELGGRGWVHPPLLPWKRGKKIDNYLATGYTAKDPLCITRGNDDPSDDLEVLPGEAWVSISSPVEGVSRVVARTPSVESWQNRRSEATIYWVDVQWSFPPATVSSSGRPVTLTTTLTRQTDGTPIEGWVVRYATAEAAQLGASATGQSSEVRTGADGRASVEISPTDSGAPSTQIHLQLIRPAGVGGAESPRLLIASGSTLIAWTGDTAPYVSPNGPVTPAPGAQPYTPVPPTEGAAPYAPLPGGGVIPPASAGPAPPTTATPQPQARPALDIEIRGDRQAQAGGVARFEVVVRNTGDAPATRVLVNDRFDEGFSHLKDPQRNLYVDRELGTLAPGQSSTVFLSFDVLRAGQLCHDVTVTCGETAPVSKRACIEAGSAAPEQQPGLKVDLDGPAQAMAGSTALFTLSVKNTGQAPLANVVVQAEFPPNLLEPQPREQGFVIEQSKLVWRLPNLDVGQTRRFDIDVRCLRQVLQTPCYAGATAEAVVGGRTVQVPTYDEHLLEVTPATDATPSRPSGPASPEASGSPLRIRVESRANPVQAGASTICQITVQNLASQTDEEVELRVRFPRELAPNLTQAQGPPTVRVEMLDGIVRFSPVAALRAGEAINFLVPVSASQAGTVEIVAEVQSRNVPAGRVQEVYNLEIRRN